MTPISRIVLIWITGFLSLFPASVPCLAQSASATPAVRTRSDTVAVSKTKTADKQMAAMREILKGARADPTKPQPTDLRPILKQIKLRDRGPNVIYRAKGHTVLADARNRKIIRWSATGADGKTLPIQVVIDRAGCGLGVSMPDGRSICYLIDCADAPGINPTKQP